jgi:hypothetical protein
MFGLLCKQADAQPSVRNNAPAAPARAAGRIAVRAMSESRNLKIIKALVDAYDQSEQLDVRGDDKALLSRFCDSDQPFDILVTSNIAYHSNEDWALPLGFPADKSQPLRIVLGQSRVFLIVESKSSVGAITLSQIHKVLGAEAKGKSWRQAIGRGSGTAMRCFGPREKTNGTIILRKTCLQYWTQLSKYAKQLHIDTIRDDLKQCDNVPEIVKGVRAAGSSGLGVVGYPVQADDEIWRGVKPLAIKTDAGNEMTPALRAAVQPNYPLAETILLYVHPKAVDQVEEFIRL